MQWVGLRQRPEARRAPEAADEAGWPGGRPGISALMVEGLALCSPACSGPLIQQGARPVPRVHLALVHQDRVLQKLR